MKNTIAAVWERYRYPSILLKQLVITDFKLRYKGSSLGYLWSLLKPLALFGILYAVFSVFLRVGEGVPHFPVYLLLGIVVWNYFAEVTNNSVTSIVMREDLLRKINFPRYAIVLSTSFSALINLIINMFVVFFFMEVGGVDYRVELLLAPIVLAQLFILGVAMSFFLSALYVRFRDINYIWEVIMQGAFYITPILWPIQLALEESVFAAKAIMLSPMSQIIQDIRYMMITEDTLRIDQVFDGHLIRVIPYGITIMIAVVAAVYFRSRSKNFAEEL